MGPRRPGRRDALDHATSTSDTGFLARSSRMPGSTPPMPRRSSRRRRRFRWCAASARSRSPPPRPIASSPARPARCRTSAGCAASRCCEKYGLSWDLRVPFWHLAEAAEVARAFPDTPIVLNHTGFPWDRSDEGLAAWRRQMEVLAREPNVHVKVSEFGLKDRAWDYESNRRVVLDALAIFGVERAMFATNFPVAGLRIGYGDLVAAMSRMLAICRRTSATGFSGRTPKPSIDFDLPRIKSASMAVRSRGQISAADGPNPCNHAVFFRGLPPCCLCRADRQHTLAGETYPGQGVPSQLLVIVDDSVTNLKIIERLALSLGGGAAAKRLFRCRRRSRILHAIPSRPGAAGGGDRFRRSGRHDDAAARRTRCAGIPIIVVGSDQDLDAIERARAAGAADHILVPIDQRDFHIRARAQLVARCRS